MFSYWAAINYRITLDIHQYFVLDGYVVHKVFQLRLFQYSWCCWKLRSNTDDAATMRSQRHKKNHYVMASHIYGCGQLFKTSSFLEVVILVFNCNVLFINCCVTCKCYDFYICRLLDQGIWCHIVPRKE